MNILRLVTSSNFDNASPEFKKIEMEASRTSKDFKPAIIIDKKMLSEKLTPIEYHVTQEKGTEKPFSGKYVRHKEDGSYSCLVCDLTIFDSSDKFETACGWPSFSDAIKNTVVYRHDYSNCIPRIEVICINCGSHLGHVFNDSVKKNQLRYCINSASLNFKSKLRKSQPSDN